MGWTPMELRSLDAPRREAEKKLKAERAKTRQLRADLEAAQQRIAELVHVEHFARRVLSGYEDALFDGSRDDAARNLINDLRDALTGIRTRTTGRPLAEATVQESLDRCMGNLIDSESCKLLMAAQRRIAKLDAVAEAARHVHVELRDRGWIGEGIDTLQAALAALDTPEVQHG